MLRYCERREELQRAKLHTEQLKREAELVQSLGIFPSHKMHRWHYTYGDADQIQVTGYSIAEAMSNFYKAFHSTTHPPSQPTTFRGIVSLFSLHTLINERTQLIMNDITKLSEATQRLIETATTNAKDAALIAKDTNLVVKKVSDTLSELAGKTALTEEDNAKISQSITDLNSVSDSLTASNQSLEASAQALESALPVAEGDSTEKASESAEATGS